MSTGPRHASHARGIEGCGIAAAAITRGTPGCWGEDNGACRCRGGGATAASRRVDLRRVGDYAGPRDRGGGGRPSRAGDGLHPSRNHCIPSKLGYTPGDDSLKCLHRSQNHRIPSRLAYTPCYDYPRGLHPSGNHHIPSRLVYTPCDDSLKCRHPSGNHRIPSRLVYTPYNDSLKDPHPSGNYRIPRAMICPGVYTPHGIVTSPPS